jgi:hypothetical protein
MTGPIDPIRPVRLIRREAPKPAADEADDGATLNVNINVTAPPPPDPAPPSPRQPVPNTQTHLIAQEARVRGLRGGPNVLETARSAYLDAEWRGPNDRRAKTGKITKTEI